MADGFLILIPVRYCLLFIVNDDVTFLNVSVPSRYGEVLIRLPILVLVISISPLINLNTGDAALIDPFIVPLVHLGHVIEVKLFAYCIILSKLHPDTSVFNSLTIDKLLILLAV